MPARKAKKVTSKKSSSKKSAAKKISAKPQPDPSAHGVDPVDHDWFETLDDVEFSGGPREEFDAAIDRTIEDVIEVLNQTTADVEDIIETLKDRIRTV